MGRSDRRKLRLCAMVLGASAVHCAASPAPTPEAPPAVAARPPSPPDGPNVPGEVRWLVLQSWQFGAYDASGKRTARGWADLGFDLDGRVTTAALSKSGEQTCRHLEGSPHDILTDGRDGIDNQFGSVVVAPLYSICPTLPHGDIALGDSFTLLLRLEDVGGPDDPSAPGSLFVARRSPGATDWILDDALLEAGMSVSKVRFPSGFVRNGRWWSGPTNVTVPLELPLCDISVPFRLDLRALTVRLDGSDGMLGGFARTAALRDAQALLLPAVGICPGTADYDIAHNTVEQGVDLVADAPGLQALGRVCNALSVGLGFVAKPTAPPTAHGPFVPAEVVHRCK